VSKISDPERKARKQMREVCAHCNQPFGLHGAVPPHTRGPDECAGFISKDTKHIRHRSGEK